MFGPVNSFSSLLPYWDRASSVPATQHILVVLQQRNPSGEKELLDHQVFGSQIFLVFLSSGLLIPD